MDYEHRSKYSYALSSQISRVSVRTNHIVVSLVQLLQKEGEGLRYPLGENALYIEKLSTIY
jgi:hypothetical protein